MATYEQTMSSEGEYDFNCTPCTNRERNTEAKKFCVECGEYFCTTCLSFHEHFGATKGHTLINCAEVSTCQVASRLTKCEIHTDKEEDMVCGEHDIICCRVCIATDHRTCQDTNYLPQAAQNFGESKSFSELTRNTRRKIEELQKVLKEQKICVVQTKMRKVTLSKRLQQYKTSMTNLIENLVNESETELEKAYGPAVSGMQRYMQDTDEQLSRLSDVLEDLTHENDEMLVYKKSMECKRALRETHIKQRKVDLKMPECDGTMNRIMQTVVNLAKDDSNLDVVDIAELGSDSVVPDICKMQDGSFCLALFHESKIVRIDRNLKPVVICSVEAKVWGVCSTLQNEIAFTMPGLKVVSFLRFETRPVLKRNISTTVHCRGIAFQGEKLYVAGNGFDGEGYGQIHILDLKGQILQTFMKDSDGKMFFNIPRSVLVSAECIYVTDSQIGVICLDMYGKRQWVCEKIKFPWGICFSNNKGLLIAGRDSNNIVVVSRNGEGVGELLNKADGIKSPKALSFDEQSRRLLVTTSNGRLLKKFDFAEFEI